MSNKIYKNELSLVGLEEKSERIIELENHPEFKKLSYNQQIILLTGEKLLQVDQKLRSQTSFINDFIKEYGYAISNIATNQKNINNFITDLVKNEVNNLITKNGVPQIDENKIVDLVQEIYSDEISTMENRLESITQETIKNFDNSFNETFEKINDLVQFEIRAKQEIQNNQDRIYILEEEIARQKEVNESLKSLIDEKLSSMVINNDGEQNSIINNYKYYDSRFNSLEELEEFIKDEAKKIAKIEVEKYIHDYNLFNEDRSDELVEKLFEEEQLKDSEMLNIYKLQIENNNKMNDLEYLLDEQNRQIRLLSEDRQNLIKSLSDVLSDKDVDINKILESFPPSDFSDDFILRKTEYPRQDNILSNDEMEILVKKQAIELVKQKIDILNSKKNTNKNLKELTDVSENEQNDIQKYFDETNNKIKALEEELKHQIEENDILKNDLFDEISKNNIDNQNIDFTIENNGNIDNELAYQNFLQMTKEELELMKHNYYNGSTPIPGTRITRINNYKINSDVNTPSFIQDAQQAIKQDIEHKEVEKQVEQKQFVEPVGNSSWQESNQKLVDLENLIFRQEEEIKRLRDNKGDNNQLLKDNGSTLNSIDESIKVALSKLQDLTSVQEKTKKEIEETNKKIIELESQFKKTKNTAYEDELARKELDKIIEEKYKLSQKENHLNYSEEIKKIEAERRKIEETLELERIRLLSEIENNRKKLNDFQEVPLTNNVVEQPPVQKVEPIAKPQPKEEVKFVLESPKKKRKQQVFYEIKIHSTPKLTRADLEK